MEKIISGEQSAMWMILDRHQDQQDFTPWPINNIHATLIWSKASGEPRQPVFCGWKGRRRAGSLKAKPEGHKGRGLPLSKKDEIGSFIPLPDAERTQFFKKHMDIP